MSKKNILIITPHSEFGDIVSMSLGNEASLDVTVASTVSAMDTYMEKSKVFHFALLDLELGDEKVLEHGFSLRSRFPGIGLILMSKKDPSRELDELRPWKLLRKPFVLNELTSLFRDGEDDLHAEPEIINMNFQDAMENAIPVWLDDAVRVTQTLVSAISNLDVQEAILFSNEDILAQAGKMQPDAIEECSRLVGKFEKEKDAAEVIKPVHLKTTSTNHLMHSSVLAVGILLTLLYDADTPYKIMRTHTRYLTNILKNPQLSNPEVHILPEIPETRKDNRNLPPVLRDLDSSIPSNDTPKTYQPRPVQPYRRLLRNHSKPAFPKARANSTFHMDDNFGENISMPSVDTPTEHTNGWDTPAAWADLMHPQPGNQDQQTSAWASQTLDLTGSPVQVMGELPRYSLCSADPSLFNVYYSCLLIPRIKSQLLDGDLGNFLKEDFPKIFQAFGWRLEIFEIDRSYLQWLVRIPPTTAPARHINVVRMQSSQEILKTFASLNRNHLLRDFWAPGYLLGCGPRLLPTGDITEFIRMNRRQHYPEENLSRFPQSRYQTYNSYS